ncbi:hypothetical protein EDD86DRAFT_89645 [Gorgonomyces haynaldii]|nr:hypothetical protein EDD86DRAFT_89645 [Gorgonomyces haynaldii]
MTPFPLELVDTLVDQIIDKPDFLSLLLNMRLVCSSWELLVTKKLLRTIRNPQLALHLCRYLSRISVLDIDFPLSHTHNSLLQRLIPHLQCKSLVLNHCHMISMDLILSLLSLSCLECITIKGTIQGKVDPNRKLDLTNLKELNLDLINDRGGLSSFAVSKIGPRLERVRISKISAQDLVILLERAPKLRSLTLKACTFAHPVQLPKIENIQELSLSFCFVDFMIFEQMIKAPRLSQLDVSFTTGGDSFLNMIMLYCRNLSVLAIDGFPCSQKVLEQVIRSLDLKALSLAWHNDVLTPNLLDAVQALKVQLKGCKFRH